MTETEELQGPQHPDDVRRERDRLRKRDSRAKERQAKIAAAKAKAAGEAESFSEYWAQQRANLTPDQIAEYEARENEVSLLEWLMARYLEGSYELIADEAGLTSEERVTLPQLIATVSEDVTSHGLVEMGVLAVSKLWTEAEKTLRDSIESKGGATAILVRYGYLVGICSRAYQDFHERFLVTRAPIKNYGTPLKCAECGVVDTVNDAVAADYERSRLKYYCPRCWAVEKNARLQATRPPTPTIRIGNTTVIDGKGRAYPEVDPFRVYDRGPR